MLNRSAAEVCGRSLLLMLNRSVWAIIVVDVEQKCVGDDCC